MRGPQGARRGPALGDIGIITDGAVLIQDGLIVEVGPSRRVENLASARGAVEISAAGRVVMPGFVDSHTHLLYPPRGERAADPAGAARVWRASSVRLLAARCRPFLDAMARHGVTTVEMKTGCGADGAAELKALRVASLLRSGPIDVAPTCLLRPPGGLAPDAAEAVLDDMAQRLLRPSLATFADIWWDGASPLEAAHARVAAIAAAAGIGLKVHAEGPACAGAVALAVGHRAASVDHIEHLTPDLAPLLAEARTVATLTPGGALDPWAPVPPARALIDSGAAVALASNFNPHQTPNLTMQTVIALACMRLEMTPAEAIAAATINGAHALDLGDRVGSLEPGKRADLLLLNTDDYRDLGRSLGRNLVHGVFKSGVAIYREGSIRRAGW